MMDQALIQLGVGGIFALLIVREVLGFLKTRGGRNGSRTAGDQPPEYWQAEQRKAMSEVLVLVVVPILTTQATILNELRIGIADQARNMAVLLDRLTQQRPS